jgi:hypothetical protein
MTLPEREALDKKSIQPPTQKLYSAKVHTS